MVAALSLFLNLQGGGLPLLADAGVLLPHAVRLGVKRPFFLLELVFGRLLRGVGGGQVRFPPAYLLELGAAGAQALARLPFLRVQRLDTAAQVLERAPALGQDASLSLQDLP